MKRIGCCSHIRLQNLQCMEISSLEGSLENVNFFIYIIQTPTLGGRCKSAAITLSVMFQTSALIPMLSVAELDEFMMECLRYVCVGGAGKVVPNCSFSPVESLV